jgi:hypothetical protein
MPVIRVVCLRWQLQVGASTKRFSLERNRLSKSTFNAALVHKESTMPQLKIVRVMPIAVIGLLGLSACASSTPPADYTAANATADQALATAQHALAVAQQADADAKAANQQTSAAYQRSLTK